MDQIPIVYLYWYMFFLSFWLGASMGSFANVCIYRIPRGISVVRPRSFCPHCDHQIAWFDNIPLISWLILRRKCRHCAGAISGRYPLVELLTAICFALIWLVHGWEWTTPAYWLLTTALVIGSFIDFDHMIIPNRITIGGMFAGLLLSTLFPVLHFKLGFYDGFRASLIGLTVGALILWTVATLGTLLFRKEAMGMGDVKLLGALGAFLGWRAVVFVVMASSLLGALVGIVFIISGRKSFGSRIPFGPYLALAALLWMLIGDYSWNAYFNWLTREP